MQVNAPFEAALYQARWQASADFSYAVSQFKDRHDRVRINMPDWIGTPAEWAGRSDADIMAAAQQAQPILPAIAEFTAQISRAGAPWSKETIIKLSEATNEAERLSDCFQKIATFTTKEAAPPYWWDMLRRNLPTECSGANDNLVNTKFSQLAVAVSQAMIVEAQQRKDIVDANELANMANGLQP